MATITITVPDPKVAEFWLGFAATQEPEDLVGLDTEAQKLAFVRQRMVEFLIRQYHEGKRRTHRGTLVVEEGVVT